MHFSSKSVDVRVVTGSQPLTPPGYVGVLMRVGRGERIIAAYERAMKQRGLEMGASREIRDGWNVHTVTGTNDDHGFKYEQFQRAGHPSYLRLTRY